MTNGGASTDSGSEPISLGRGDWRERLRLIVETMRNMSLETEPAAVVKAYTERIGQLVPGDRLISVSRRGVLPPSYRIARDSGRPEQPDPWSERHLQPVHQGGLLGELIYSNEPRLIDDLQVPDDDPAHDRLGGSRSLLAVPIFDGGEALNMVVFLHDEPAAFNPQIAPEMVWISNLFGRATHNLVLSDELRRAHDALDAEMKVIADIQRSLLPAELPEIPGLDIATHYQPAAHAGGDYYDFFPRPDGTWGMLVGDVSGHGSPAAVLMAVCHCLAHTGPGHELSPAGVFAYVSDHLERLYTGGNGSFITAFFGVYDPATCQLTYSLAGHPPPRLKRCSDGSLLSLDGGGGPPLGILPGIPYGESTIELVPGDQLVVFTDGITETFDPDGQMFGMQRLDQTLELCSVQASDLRAVILEAVSGFARGRAPADDQTLVVVKAT